MQFTRSGLAVAAGFIVFALLFRLLGPGLGAILTVLPAGAMAGYLTARIAGSRQMMHIGAVAGTIGAWLMFYPGLSLPARLAIAALAAAAVTAGGWVRVNAHGVEPVEMTGNEHRATEERKGQS